MKTSPTNWKIRQLITMVKEEKLIPRPEFQRRLVWKISDKNHFLDSIIEGYPFPEIYVADGDVNLETGEGTQLLVDGLQRVSTITQYFDADPDLKLTTVPAYRDLSPEKKTAFLQYDVAVRDLGAVNADQLVEVFRRINATSYSLRDIEIHNARFRGELKEFADRFSQINFFSDHRVFNAADYRRMGDLRFALSIIIACMAGYSNRDDLFERMLEFYNDELPNSAELGSNLDNVASFIEECGFDKHSRVWRKADLYTLFVELYLAQCKEELELQPSNVINVLQPFFETVDRGDFEGNRLAATYYKAALQASNDRVNRVRRGAIVGGLIRGVGSDELEATLIQAEML
ncbi:DUF262 domain-containing protein [Sphingomonas sp. G124]|uniref:DUF262 domain-containing protein n=1 Tax=Sphingomonas cremea TaxID=2904799 RepID=A0A9X1QJH6_9SPHN|nr:DUF262 domain-containing protein [Sphingomonas cremea]MCF2514873.1 DUF262 domain-containing protein [Sphingomonas cremea]